MIENICQGPFRRREFLRLGSLALGGMALPESIAARASTQSPDTSVILFWMWGGPSQYETWDPKPNAPDTIRGPFRPIPTKVPGMDICEVFPLQARIADKFSLVRSLHHKMSAHNDGSIEVLTGKTPPVPDLTSTNFSDHPDFGMIASRERGFRADGMPQYVGIPKVPFMVRPTYLGVSHSGFPTGDPSLPGFRPGALTLDAGLNASRLDDRRGLMRQFDALRKSYSLASGYAGDDPLRDVAHHMLTNPNVARAFDISREDPRLRDRYGRHLWGQACLLARRLAESGSSVITIDALAPTLSDRYFSWDDHINPMTRWDMADAMKYRAPFMDQAITALIEDVYARGLDKKVMIVAAGEFGRTPKVVRHDGLIGRDHWPDAMSALVSGGGLKMGQVIGSTDRQGAYPADRPLTPKDLLATIYRHLGIDPATTFHDTTGRPVPILNHGEPIRELV
ncbi:DUF1501 domain-containing protein [bacterium]|nr:DUF1501 domain-containing protein [bacterium]